MHLGLELTFLPRRCPEGFPGSIGDKENYCTVKQFARLLKRREMATAFTPKREGFGALHSIVEVTSDLISEYALGGQPLKRSLTRVFAVARELGLSGRISHTRGGVTKVFPDGGSHIHSSIDLFGGDHRPSFLHDLARFQCNLFTDYANRPYVKWLFAHPFDDLNSKVVYAHEDMGSNAVKRVYEGYTGIVPRFTGMRRHAMPTFEHRYFGAAQTAQEALDNLVFVNNWVAHLRKLTLTRQRLKVTLTPSYFRSLKQARFAWREVSDFLRLIGCNPDAYREPFERNYLTRMRWGKMA